MAQNQNNNSTGVLDKMYNATIGQIFYRPRPSQSSLQTTKASTELSPTLTKPSHNIVHHSSQTKTTPLEIENNKNKNNNVKISSSNSQSNGTSQEVANLPRWHAENGDRGKKLEHTKTNEKFSDYIVKVKDKMRITSDVKDVKIVTKRTATKRDSFNDKVSNYINRAKFQIRTTTSVGDDKGASFK